jgi:preprotein translocase SecF subunit
MLQVFKSPNINFIGNKNKAFILSAFLIGVSLLSMLIPIYPGRGIGLNRGIDFVGGTVVQLAFEKPVVGDLGAIREIVSELDYGTPQVKTIGGVGDHELQITVKATAEGNRVADEIKGALNANYPDNLYEVRRQEKIGPKIGSELGRKAIWAILLSLIVIVFYIGLRFNFPFGVAAIAALFHDVFITLGVFSVLNLEMSLPIVAALLTIVGYSLNDTIVVFDRIRENLTGGTTKRSFDDRVNSSINETLSRTVMTSLTTLMTVVVVFGMFFTSGDVIRDFALALLVGVIVGTYSSMFVASPLVVLWNRKWPIK